MSSQQLQHQHSSMGEPQSASSSESPTGNSFSSLSMSVGKLSASPASSSSEITNASPTVLVAGGGITGLLAGVALTAIGCDVHIFERSSKQASADAALPLTQQLSNFLSTYDVKMLATKPVLTQGRQVLGHDGEVLLEDSHEQQYVSREALYMALRAAFPKDQYYKAEVVGVDTSRSDCITITLDTAERVSGHLLVCADGPLSSIREALAPGLVPSYAGYLCWQGLVQQVDLPAEISELLADRTTIYKGVNQHMLVHPVPDAGGLPLAWSWFNNQDASELPDLLLDKAGTSHHLSVGMGQLSPQVAAAVVTATQQALPPPLAALVACSTSSMSASAVSDLVSPQMAFDRVALLGAAAGLVRPHATSSVVGQAAGAIMSLAEALKSRKFVVPRALAAWEAAALPALVKAARDSARAGDRLQGLQY